jgi:glycosyltransferase involved in cell wall biosynthesis
MIFLNAEKFILEAIESVFAQTYPHWELLLIDDGSTDESTAIAKRYADQHPQRVRYLEHPGHQNRGMSASRNLGIRKSKGHYNAFLDADDVWLPEKLEKQVQILDREQKAGMVYGATQYWHSWTGKTEDKAKDYIQKASLPSITLLYPPALLTLFLQKRTAIPCMCSLVVKREVLTAIGGFEETFRNMYEDQAFYAKVALETPVIVTNECLDRYRQHPDSCCAQAESAGKTHSAHLFYLDWLTSYLTEQGFNGSEVWRVFQRERWLYRYPVLRRLVNRSQRLLRKNIKKKFL